MSNKPIDKIRSAVRGLARRQTADRIAQFFVARGIRGMKGTAIMCPVSTYLQGKVPGFQVKSWRDEIMLLGKRSAVTVKTPAAVSEFMYLFDRGDFPDLES